MKLSKDGWTGLACLTASLVLFAFTIGLKDNPLVPIGPDFYPRILLGVTALLAAGVAMTSILAPAAAPTAAPSPNYRLVALCFATFFIYVLLLPVLGFRFATLIFLVALQIVIDPPTGTRRWTTVALVALITTGVTYVVFERYLSVLLPRGSWTGF